MTSIRFTLSTCAVVIATVLAPSMSAAQTTAGAIRSSIKEGQKVSVTDDQGHEFKGRISLLTAGSLSLLDGKTSTDIAYDRIVRIDRPKDGLGNGALIGFGIGAAVGLASLAYEDARSCDPMVFFDCLDANAGAYAAVAMIIGGLGAAVGVGIDALFHRDSALYHRGNTRITLAPAVGHGKRAAVLSVSW